jgi:hypothetical protein
MSGRRASFVLPLLALPACGNDASGGLENGDSSPIDAVPPIASSVAVFDVLGRLVALYPLGDATQEPPEAIPGEHVASDEAFELFATELGMNLGARITFDHAYDASEPHMFLAISRFGTRVIRSLRVNAMDPKSWDRLTGSDVLRLAPDAPAQGSIVHVNPDCFVRGAYWGTASYNDGELTLRAVPSSGARDAGEPYELSLFISDYTERCR